MQESVTPKRPAADGISIIPNKSDEFIHAWLEIMKPIHNLTAREIDVTAILLSKREDIARKVADQNMIDKVLFEEETLQEVREEAGVSKTYMNVILNKLKKSGIVVNGKHISPTYILNWTPGKPFRMVFIFKNDA